MMFFTQVTLAVVLLPLTLLSAAITSESFTRKGKCKSLRPTNWTPCSSSCGSGYSIRIQFVNINKPKGTFCRRVTSRRNCKRGACAASGKCPSEWTSWTACSTTCEGGRRTRRRNRKIGNEGDCYEVQEQFLCNQDIPCSQTPLSMEGFPSPSPSPKFTPTPKLTVTPTHPPNCPLPCLGNGVVAQPRKETYQLEDAVTCSCEDSSLFILEGMADHLCVRSDSGTAVWSNGGTLRCVPNTSDDEPTTVGPTAASTAKLCQPLANVKGAYIAKRKEEYHVGDVAKYVCRPKRFVIEGNDIVRCVDTGAELGVWIVVPVCRLKADQCQEGPWSPCSQTCGKGEQTRVVERFHGKTCRNETEKRSCQIDTECATPTPVFHPCGGKIGSPVAAGSFSSPGYPVAYPNSMTCEWDIQAEAGQTISIIFATGETEPMYDVVEVWDGDTIMDSLSNVFHTVKLRSKTNKVMVRMVTDSLEQSRGFSATYQIKGSNDAKICSKELVATKKSQKISSPANGVNCTWIIRARSCCLDVTNLEVSFTQLQTKGKEEVIEIRSGATESSPLVGYYHGHVTPGNPIRLKSCFAYVRYWSVPASNPSGNFELNFYVKSS
eukprot:m.183885 g.183885  ORF g.183885 m.183885 type:complete len:605 (+) comp39314_c0_seq7:144-1958(+)